MQSAEDGGDKQEATASVYGDLQEAEDEEEELREIKWVKHFLKQYFTEQL